MSTTGGYRSLQVLVWPLVDLLFDISTLFMRQQAARGKTQTSLDAWSMDVATFSCTFLCHSGFGTLLSSKKHQMDMQRVPYRHSQILIRRIYDDR